MSPGHGRASPLDGPLDPQGLVEGQPEASRAVATAAEPGPLASTLVVPNTPAATSPGPDQQRSSGGHVCAAAFGKAAATYCGTAACHSSASSCESQRRTIAATRSPPKP